MSEAQASQPPLAEARPDDAFALERHFFSGGHRVEMLGRDKARPAWLPPADYVGLRQDVTLPPGEHIVEFARFAHRGQKITWIAVFKHAIDAQYGDRANHEGVGAWLLDHDVVHAAALLTSLRRLLDLDHASDGVPAQADQFRSTLGPYLRAGADWPAPVAGWPFAPGRATDVAIFIATPDEGRDPWGAAAEQLLRMSNLAPTSGSRSRALVCIRAPGATAADPADAQHRVPEGLGGEIVAALPAALQALREDADKSRHALRTEQDRTAGLTSQLAAATEARADADQQAEQLRATVADLQAQLEGNEPARQWALLRAAIGDLNDEVKASAAQSSRTERTVQLLREELQWRAGSSNPPRPLPPQAPPRPPSQPVKIVTSGSASGDKWGQQDWTTLLIAGGIVTTLLIVLAVMMFWPASTP